MKPTRAIILGAGASYAHSDEMPLAATFLAKALLRKGEVKANGGRHDEELISLIERLYSTSRDLRSFPDSLSRINIEELMTLADLEDLVDPGSVRKRLLVEFIARSIVACQELADGDGTYDVFLAEVLGDRDSVITFNWDTLLDRRLEVRQGKGTLFKRYLETCTAETDDSWKGLAAQRPYQNPRERPSRDLESEDFVAYLKLHGSVDLVVCVNTQCPLHQRPYRTTHSPWGVKCGACREPLVAHIVPPALDKRIRESSYIRRAWTYAREIVEQCDEVLAWGYSLPTTDFWANWLIRAAWFGRCRRLTIINPDAFFWHGLQRHKTNPGFIGRYVPASLPTRAGLEVWISPTLEQFVEGRRRRVRKY